MSRKFDLVKHYYDAGLWVMERVKNAVIKGWITEEEYRQITGEGYQ